MKKYKNIIRVVSCLLTAFLMLAAITRHRDPASEGVVARYEDTLIPNVWQLQKYLNNCNNPRYYCGEIDGVIGKKTIKAWENWSFDQEAGKYFTEKGSPK